MLKHLEQTLVILKPDTVERGLIGKVITRFEDVGLKIVAMKMVQSDAEMAGKHYDEDLAKRRGEHIRQYNVDFITSGPIVPIVVEGIAVIENVRKMCGDTEPKSSPPGTIRGDFSHMNYGHCDDCNIVTKNIIHASADAKDAEKEIKLWFEKDEILDYSSVHERHTR